METEARLDSWKKIASYLQRDERTVQRWHAQSGLPVHHVPGPKRSSVFAYRSEIDAWLESASNAKQPVAQTSDVILEAFDLWECRSERNMLRIIEFSQNAILTNPRDADAYAILASAYVWSSYIDLIPSSFAFVRAERALRKALCANPGQIYARCAQAWLTMCQVHDWELAKEQFRECLALAPELAFALIGLATVCTMDREFDEANALARRAWKAEPLSASLSYAVIRLHYYMGEFHRVISEAQLAINSGDDSSGLRVLYGLAHAALGEEASALRVLQQASRDYSENLLVKGALGYAHAVAGHPAEAKAILAELSTQQANMKACSTYASALVCAGLNDSDQVIHCFKKGDRELSIWGLAVQLDEMFAFLKHDERFLAITSQCKCPRSQRFG